MCFFLTLEKNMKETNRKTFRLRNILAFLCVSVLLSACVWPEKNDPFERLPEEELETIEGTIYPFSVSVSTRATHRLEKDNHLVAFLASNIIRLEDFEGRKATLAISATSHWADFESQSGRHTNPTEQKLLHTGDTFFDKATETQKDIQWGKD